MDSGRLIFNAYPGNMIFIGNNDPVFRGSRSLFNVEDTLKKRPFYSSPDELVEEEFYDEQVPEKKRRLTPEQVHILERSFEAENKLEPERKSDLAKKLGLQPRQVAVWFQNRRARWKTKQLEHEYDLLKSSYHSLLADHDNLAKDNEKLKSEVISLVEKLQAKEAGEKGGQLQENGKIGVDVKIEDHLSSGSVESAVVDEDGRQLIDSGASYFPDYGCCMGVERIQSEEEGKMISASIAGSIFLMGTGVAGQHQQQEEVEDEQLGWLVWF